MQNVGDSIKPENLEITQFPDTQTPSEIKDNIKTPTIDVNNSVLDESIPVCTNSDQPISISQLAQIPGDIVYRSHEGKNWYLLSGQPLKTETINPLKEGMDSIAFSKNGNWMLAYSASPMDIGEENKYPVWLISKEGEANKVVLDISHLTSIEKDQICSTCHLLNWYFSWVNEDIVRVRAAYGESSNRIIPDFIFGYYDFRNRAWKDQFPRHLPNRLEYDWFDYSPDLSRSLYTTRDFEIALWDNEQQKELWKIASGTNQLPPYAGWSSDNQMVAFWTDNLPEDVQLISRDGKYYEVIRKPNYENPALRFVPYRGFFEWAPDGQRLAISGRIVDQQFNVIQTILYIFDVKSGKYVYQCPFGDKDEHTISSNILWSPDGELIIPEVSQSRTTPLNLFDIKNNIVYRIQPPGYAGVVWLEDFPAAWK